MQTRRLKSCAARMAVLITALMPLGASAASPRSPDTAEMITRLLQQYQLSDTQFANDGSRAAFAAREPLSGPKEKSSIWLYETKAGGVRRLTTTEGRDTQPRWSADNATLAFLSERGDTRAQIYLLPPAGGEARLVTHVFRGVQSFEWSPTGRQIAYLGADSVVESAEKSNGDDEMLGSVEYGPTRLMLVDVDSGKSRRLIPGAAWAVSQFAWVPNGRQIVVAATDHYLPEATIERLYVVSVEDGSMREIGRIEGVEYSNFQVSPDGKFLAYIGSSAGPTTHDLFVQPLNGGAARNLTGAGSTAAIDRPMSDVAWTGPTQLTFTTQEGFGNAIRSVNLDGTARILKKFPDHQISALAVARGQLLYARTDQVTPVELWVSSNGVDRKVSNFHGDFGGLLPPQLIRFPSADGFEIEAALYRPAQAHGRQPTVVLVHGGPTGRWSHEITDWAQLLAANGYVVLAPNIRGSSGYGEAFLMANKADWGGGDFRDVIAGVDYLIERGIADAERLAIAGWSYGGYMGAWTITQTQRFKAAVIGAGMFDLSVQWGAELPALVPYDRWYIGTPWDQPENFQRMSPATQVKRVTTPTLLLVGAEDSVNHTAQNWQFYRGLRMNGVESELVIYPREGHRIQEELHARDAMTRMVDWIGLHLR